MGTHCRPKPLMGLELHLDVDVVDMETAISWKMPKKCTFTFIIQYFYEFNSLKQGWATLMSWGQQKNVTHHEGPQCLAGLHTHIHTHTCSHSWPFGGPK
jgi:hypothetical protein